MKIAVNFEPGNNNVRIVRIVTDATFAQVTTPGWYSQMAPNQLQPSDEVEIAYLQGLTGARTAFFDVTITAGIVTLSLAESVVTVSTASATPGTIRAIKGAVSSAIPVMTSGNLVGVRGEVDLVGASAGFVYGLQGKVIPTGTLSGSVWAPAVFGQYDLSAATINGGQIAALWGDMGASGGTFTDVTGARGIALTNTIASLTLFAMDYRYGKATNLFELDGSAGTYISAGAATPSGDLKKIAISIDGVTHYILAAAVWS